MAYNFTTFEELAEIVNPDLPIMFDTETIGLYGKIRLAQFYQKHWECTQMIEYPDPIKLMSFLSKYNIVMHNAHYDITCTQTNLPVRMPWVPENFECTFLLARLYFYTKDGFSLDKVVEYVLGYNPYENKKDLQGSDWSVPVLSEAQLQYASNDTLYLQQVYDVVKEAEDDINYKLDKLMLRYCLDFQNNGLPLDEDRLNEQYVKNMGIINEINLPINCNSYQQVRPYINSSQSDDLALARLSLEGNEKAKAVRRVRKLTKENSFLTKYLTTAENGEIFGKFKCSARSGRTTSDDQNKQQLPRKTKGCFGVTEDSGKVLIYSDFAQIQLRGVCVVTGDEKLEELFRGGADLHNYVAEMIFGKDFTRRQRQIAKTANFGLLFGAGVITFQNILIKEADIFLSEDECRKIKKMWLGLWKQVAVWQKEGIKAQKKGLAWETPLGRRYTAKLMTDQLAMQIQGFEAEVAKLALHYMWSKLDTLSSDIKLANFIHDSYIFTAPNEQDLYIEACDIIADCMQEAWSEMSQAVKITDLPMPTNVRVGYNWGDIESDKFIYEVNK